MIPRLGVGLLAVLLSGCALEPLDDAFDHHGDEGNGEPIAEVSSAISVYEASQSSCTTTAVKGLSVQIVEQMNCIVPNAMAEVPKPSNASFGAAVFPYLQSPAKDAFVKALASKSTTSITVNSMFRTVAQQYLLYQWYQQNKCGIGLAATPGSSNHESGLAVDVSQYSTWRTALEAQGFKWLGSSDPVHFDYAGGGINNLKGKDVLAFQMLWNANHPNDPIDADGAYGPQTESRLKQAPATGFATGATCQADGDGDGVLDESDNCPNDANAGQADSDQDGIGDACDTDSGSGGSGGSAGAAGDGGTAGSSGGAASGGASGSGGSGWAGSAGTTSASGGTAGSGQHSNVVAGDEGGCRVGRSSRGRELSALALLGLLIAFRKLRRGREARHPQRGVT